VQIDPGELLELATAIADRLTERKVQPESIAKGQPEPMAIANLLVSSLRGREFAATKIYRTIFGVSLSESKSALEAAEARSAALQPITPLSS
jgi:ribosomal protein L7/L12